MVPGVSNAALHDVDSGLGTGEVGFAVGVGLDLVVAVKVGTSLVSASNGEVGHTSLLTLAVVLAVGTNTIGGESLATCVVVEA